MAVQFIVGRSGSGKTFKILEEVRHSLRTNPNGKPIIYLVPDQMTFLSEYALVTSPELKGMIRAQVYSFTRLAWRILQETGGMGRYHLTNVGLNMLIRKIIDEKKDELTLFKKASDKIGFVGHVEQMVTEFRRYCISPEELVQKTSTESSKALQDKLHDLELIYKAFEESVVGKYIDTEDYFQLLSEAIDQSSYIQSADVYIDGFHSFTPQEYMVIQKLMKNCENVTVALTIDRATHRAGGQTKSLFRMTEETYDVLDNITKELGITRQDDIVLKESERYNHHSIEHIEEYWEDRPAVPFIGETAIKLIEASNRRAEVEGVAREIRRLTREEGYRYKEITVLVRNSAEYQSIMETIFYDNEIPYFIDQKRTMLNHPLIELIRSTLDIMNTHWRYEPVFRAVKTDLLFPLDRNASQLREQMDRLENYVLAYGIKGDAWLKKDRWKYRRFRGLELTSVAQTDEEKQIEHEINELRLFIAAPILRFFRRLKKKATVRELCEVLYLYLDELDIPDKLERLAQRAEEKGNLVVAREHNQAWNGVMDLLDQYVEILGEEEVTLKKFTSILEAGIESMKFSLVPPAIDQVIVANLELSRLADIRTAFVLGVNDGVLPAKIPEEGVLSDEDREVLISSGMNIAPSSKTKLEDEEFIAYKAFTSPSERLYVSYPIANEEGKALLPSPYIKKFQDMFPEVNKEFLVQEPSELTAEEQMQYISHPNVTISYLTAQLQLKLRAYPVSDMWWEVYNYYMKDKTRKVSAKHILSSLFYQNRVKRLTKETSEALYGETILASVSRMELFHSCPFSHYASHGLKLREREVFRLEAPDIGEMFHGALKWIADVINTERKAWSDLSKDECLKLAKAAVEFIAPKLQNQILLSSNRHHYIKRKLENIIGRASMILSEHARVSGFSPVGLELGFGPNAELPPFALTLTNGTKMQLQGRIDRVDKAVDDSGTYLRIIDYKSSIKELDFTEMYYGLSLQMLTYLDVLLEHSKTLVGTEANPAGVLYFHVHNPLVSSKKRLTQGQIEEEIFKKFKMNGLVLSNPEIVKLMDGTLENGNSNIISAGLKKDGSLTSRSKVASSQDFDVMRKYVRNKYRESGQQIITGNVEITPYKLNDRTPCQFCSYRSVCQFDQSLKDNDYKVLTPQKNDEIIACMKEEVLADE
ncbi:helicase-exonuclease AddAB subunit AddB [Bacillus spongiae]|uniref:ATP-dependent helicase/deoxyribonuclease subunit B n=1 Tax=Bacillus spongiae TaxID=2683610 RepID=A0ABU8HBH9_9BACI